MQGKEEREGLPHNNSKQSRKEEGKMNGEQYTASEIDMENIAVDTSDDISDMLARQRMLEANQW